MRTRYSACVQGESQAGKRCNFPPGPNSGKEPIPSTHATTCTQVRSLLAGCALALGLTGCGGSSPSAPASAPAASPALTPAASPTPTPPPGTASAVVASMLDGLSAYITSALTENL